MLNFLEFGFMKFCRASSCDFVTSCIFCNKITNRLFNFIITYQPLFYYKQEDIKPLQLYKESIPLQNWTLFNINIIIINSIKLMIYDTPFKHNFRESLNISSALSQSFNYKQINNDHFFKQGHNAESDPQLTNKKVKINTSFTPRNIQRANVPISSRYQDLLKEMHHIEIQKKIRANRENKVTPEVKHEQGQEVNKYLNEKFQQYNDILDHKHLMGADKQQQLSPKKSEPIKKQKIHLVLDKIKEQQKKLQSCHNLQEQHERNKKITQKYHIISKQLSNSINKKNKLSFKKLKASKFSENQQPQKKNPWQTAQIKSARYSSHVPQQPEEIDIKSPYISQTEISKNSQILKLERVNASKREFWHHRLSQLDNYFHEKMEMSDDKMIKQQDKITKVHSGMDILSCEGESKRNNQQKLQETSISEFESFSQQIKFPEIDYHHNLSEELERTKQKNLLCRYLQKQNPMFVKTKGMNNNKIIKRFDAINRAKSMIEGSSKIGKSQEEEAQEEKLIKIRQALKEKLKYKKMYERKFTKPENLTQDQSAIVDFMLEEEGDAYYWTACRNQKLNIMIKGGINRKDKHKKKKL